MAAIGLLIARLFVGLAMARMARKRHSLVRRLWLEGTGGFFETLGYKPGIFSRVWRHMVNGRGLLTALGLFGPIGPR